MVSRLADDVVLNLAGYASPVRLRPSLRAAIRLEQRFGFAALLKGITENSLTVIASIIEEAAIDDPANLMQAIEFEPLGKALPALQGKLIEFVALLIGAGDNDAEEKAPAATGKAVSFAAYHERLFSIGTGWLGWSPADTLDATPAEILAAFRGRQEMIGTVLKAVFGSAEDDDKPAEFDPEPAYEREEYLALKDLGKVR